MQTPNFPIQENGRRRSLDTICGELRRHLTQADNNNVRNTPDSDEIDNPNNEPSHFTNLLEKIKNFPLQLGSENSDIGNLLNSNADPFATSKGVDDDDLTNHNPFSPSVVGGSNFNRDNTSPGNNAFRNMLNPNVNPVDTPNFADGKGVKNFEKMDESNTNPLSPTFAGSNNFNGDDALFGGGNSLDYVKNYLANSMGSGVNTQNLLGQSNGNGFTSNYANIQKWNGDLNLFHDDIAQKDGPINNPLLSNFNDDETSTQFDRSRLFAKADDVWNDEKYDSMSNYGLPNSYYDNGDSSSPWMVGNDYTGYRRLVDDYIRQLRSEVSENLAHETMKGSILAALQGKLPSNKSPKRF